MLLVAQGPISLPAQAQYPHWLRQIGSTVNDLGGAATSDGVGGVVIGGSTLGSIGATNAGGEDAWLARYDGVGSFAWAKQLGTLQHDRLVALCVASNGAIYAAGQTEGALAGPQQALDAWVASYDVTGNLKWIHQYGTGHTEWCWAMAPDAAGGVYIGGSTFGWPFAPENPSGLDGWVARINAAGDLVWGLQFGTITNVDLRALSADGSGGFYAAGFCEGDFVQSSAGHNDAWIARYSSSGNLLWQRQFGTGENDTVSTVGPDGAGGAYVGGHRRAEGSTISDVWFARYDSAGNQLWQRTMGTPLDDELRDVEADGTGGLFACGKTTGNLVGHNNGGEDAWLARFDSQGYLVWGRQVGTNVNDTCVTVCRDLDGSAFFAGNTNGSLGGQHVGARDAWVGRYGPACAADINGNSSVDVGDLLGVITTWGPCTNCPPNTNCAADIAPFITDGDCVIDVSDLLAVITAWGPCP